MGFTNELIVFVLMFIIAAQAQEPTPNYLAWKFCIDGNYTANSTYQTNLNLLLSSLSTTFTNNNTVPRYGYRNITTGKGTDTVYGSLHCREDVTPDECSDCIQLATDEVVADTGCPNSKGAIMFYNGCVLRYSEKYFFSMLNETPYIELLSSDTITDPTPFLDTVSGLLDDLVIKAVNNTSNSPSLFATGLTNYTSSDEVYGMVQCTPDLTPSVCNTCLRSALARLSSCCFDTQGARVLYPSCTFRFEIYTFYGDYMYTNNTTSPSPPLLLPPTPLALPSPTLQSPSNSTNSNGKDSSVVLAVSIAVPLGIAVLLCISSIAVWWFCFHRKKKINNNYSAPDMDQDTQSAQSLLFNFSIISAATNNFAEAYKLGEGGFGPVYKGTLSDGQEIAVKRLAKSSGQGDREFKNEVILLAKLQHRNLVRLLGFCLHGEEKLLIYELMNASLDQLIFDPVKRTSLDWERRYKIIGGIARGLLYLHEDSRVRIIHRDLKTDNILLADDMTPKISDFGMARLFLLDQTQANTMRIVGTYGYMAPEYALHGQFSVKSDVFSFGVLVLEIISGKKNTAFYKGGAQDLLTYAWQYWQKGLVMELLDSSLMENCSRSEIMRCVHISLLCVQDNVADRPTMASIILMLDSNSVTLPLPKRPSYFVSDLAVEDACSLEVSVTDIDPR
ncbi:putative receptor-like protein kinase At4g00960 [Papaver somniferum]|uniref:putative receptor-like protein kinase At4g00960 n=1 Tax=Papaver somniferum TaxID=3469 RepID=UPI000E6F4D02|nr:putative receptor-like protein kinase At4g00960 [Papaver somniferum]